MLNYFATAGTGWLAVIAIALGGLLPYLLRRTVISCATGLDLVSGRPYLARMWPHYWIGYTVAGVSTMHASLPMMKAPMRFDPEGLWLATVALAMLWLQVWTGLLLREPMAPRTRVALRRFHFWTIFLTVTLIALHIRINR